MSDSYRDFPKHEGSKGVLQAFNRYQTLRNIKQDLGDNQASLYLEGFPKDDQVKIYTMVALIDAHGEDAVRRQVSRGK